MSINNQPANKSDELWKLIMQQENNKVIRFFQQCENKHFLNLKITPLGLNALQQVCCLGNDQLAKFLIDQGADLDQTDNYGRTPLHFACCSGQIQIVFLLLGSGADLKKIDNSNQDPLMRCVQYGQINVVHRVLTSEWGSQIDFSTRNSVGQTLLDIIKSVSQSQYEFIINNIRIQ